MQEAAPTLEMQLWDWWIMGIDGRILEMYTRMAFLSIAVSS